MFAFVEVFEKNGNGWLDVSVANLRDLIGDHRWLSRRGDMCCSLGNHHFALMWTFHREAVALVSS